MQACELYVGAASVAKVRKVNRETSSNCVEENFKMRISLSLGIDSQMGML